MVPTTEIQTAIRRQQSVCGDSKILFARNLQECEPRSKISFIAFYHATQ